MDLHGQIMNLPQTPGLPMVNATEAQLAAYKIGHRDARHAAAELALKADACVEALRTLVAAGNEFKSFSGEPPAWHVKSIPRDADLTRAREALAAMDCRAVG